MSRRRRAALLLGLAAVLGSLAASDVSRREAALDDRLAPLVDVVVARRALAAGHRIERRDLAVRRIPARFAPPGSSAGVVGGRLAVPVDQGGQVGTLLLEPPPPVGAIGKAQRAAEVIAQAAPGTVSAGSRVDVLITRESGATELALQDVEVLAAREARAQDGRRVAATLRVSLRQAVYLASAGAAAGEIRLLARAPGDRSRIAPISMRAR
jgi:pilus assembly protein CpaB